MLSGGLEGTGEGHGDGGLELQLWIVDTENDILLRPEGEGPAVPGSAQKQSWQKEDMGLFKQNSDHHSSVPQIQSAGLLRLSNKAGPPEKKKKKKKKSKPYGWVDMGL